MIPRQVTGEHSCFVDQVWVEVLIAESSLRGMEGRIGEVDAARVGQYLGVGPRDLFG
jgi:hypothetical protein